MSALLAPSSRVRETPFTPRVEACGVRAYSVYNHTLLPAAFRSIEEDYWHLLRHVQIWDVGCERQVEVRGPAAAYLTQLMTPRDLGRAQIGRCYYAPIVDHTGGMLNDPVVLKLAEDRFWLSLADSDILLWAKGLAWGLGLDVEIDEPPVTPLAVQGPKADELMARVFGEAVREIRFFRFDWLPFQGHPLAVARSGWSKQGGFEIYLDRPDLGLALWDALWDAGQDLEVGPGCPNLIERLEGGLLSYGNDMLREHDPFECGLERFCRLDGPEFVGRDALLKRFEGGLARRMRGIRFGEQPAPALSRRWRLEGDGRFAGSLGSAGWSPRFGTNIAFAMVERPWFELGSTVSVVDQEGGRHEGLVCDLPFV